MEKIEMTKQELIICNQIAIMEALKTIMAHTDKNLGPMSITWQFDHLKKMIDLSQNG